MRFHFFFFHEVEIQINVGKNWKNYKTYKHIVVDTRNYIIFYFYY